MHTEYADCITLSYMCIKKIVFGFCSDVTTSMSINQGICIKLLSKFIFLTFFFQKRLFVHVFDT